MRGLVVDDDPSIVSVVQSVLQDEGCEVVPASAGMVALARGAEERFAVIGLVLCLRRLDGRSFFRRLRDSHGALARLHLEGDFHGAIGQDVDERWDFYPLTDDAWADITEESGIRPRRPGELDGRAFEDYVLRGGPYPVT